MRSPSECNHVTGYPLKGSRITPKQAIAMKCKECIYDSCVDGNWRMQVARCDMNDCPLWQHRPKSRSQKLKPMEVEKQ